MAGGPTPTRISYGALAAGGGGLVLILSLFLDWRGISGFGSSGWESFDVIDVILFVIGLLAVGFAVLEVTRASVNLPFGRARALTTLGIVATSIVIPLFIETDHQKIGFILAALSALAILAGGILAERSPNLSLALGGGGGGAPGGGYGQQPGVGPGAGYGQQPGGGGYAQPPQQQAQPPAAAPVGGTGPGAGATAAHPQAGSPPPPPGGKADWYPDPRGQKRLRYWDGNQWTDHVAD